MQSCVDLGRLARVDLIEPLRDTFGRTPFQKFRDRDGVEPAP